MREKSLENDFFPGQGKIREFGFESGNLQKVQKVREKVREFQNFLKNDGLWQYIMYHSMS